MMACTLKLDNVRLIFFFCCWQSWCCKGLNGLNDFRLRGACFIIIIIIFASVLKHQAYLGTLENVS